MKQTTISLRVTNEDRKRIGKAAREYKNLSAFLISAARQAIKYRTLIEQAVAIEKEYQEKGLKTPKLEVRVK